jgi:hypothetical protein
VSGPNGGNVPRVLHVVVGHGLPAYFLNAVCSIRATAATDPVLIIDNASPQAGLKAELGRIADADPNCELILRSVNELRNRKVGGLYDAYALAFELAVEREFDLLHLLQGDFQMMWWDDDIVKKATEIYSSNPNCVNIQMQILSRDRKATDDLVTTDSGLVKLRSYGLTDTGLYHLGRWRELGMHFCESEQMHAKKYLAEGMEVVRHPWPTDAPIPWPAVIRNGEQQGKEVVTHKPFLLRPLSAEQVAYLKDSPAEAWLEDTCIPWGWACATPMWVSDLNSIGYWVLRYRDAKANGLTHILPRLERRGVTRADRRPLTRLYRYRPSVFRLFILAPAREAIRMLKQRKR